MPAHLVINFIVGTILINLMNLSTPEFLIFLVAGIAIDIDHVFYYSISNRSLSPKKIKDRALKDTNIMKPNFYIFHTFEVLILLYILSFNHDFFMMMFLGFGIHLLSDAIAYVRFYSRDFNWVKHWSLLWNLKNLF